MSRSSRSQENGEATKTHSDPAQCEAIAIPLKTVMYSILEGVNGIW